MISHKLFQRNLWRIFLVLICLSAYGTALAADGPTYEEVFAKARKLTDEGNLEEAFLTASVAIQLNDKRWEAYSLVALILHAKGADKEAADYINRALKRAPKNKKAQLEELAAKIGQPTEQAPQEALEPQKPQPAATDTGPQPTTKPATNKEAPPTPAAEAAVNKGTLSVKSIPSVAKVYINGSYAGLTPFETRLKEGAYEVKVTKEKHKDTGETVRVREAQQTNLAFQLENQWPTLRIKGDIKDAKVYIDGVFEGEGIDNIANMEPGKHKVEVKKKDYKTYTTEVNIEARDAEITVPGFMFEDFEASAEASKPNMVHIKIKSKNLDFWMDKYEVTQEDFRKVMGSNPSYFANCGNKCPVESVTWHEATEYCKRVSKRLPTEQEWEIAAKGGREVKYATGNGELDCTNASWGRWDGSRKCSGAEGPVAVGSYAPNAIGIYDMTGNVWELTSSPHEKGGYVIRGGGWSNTDPEYLAVSYRYNNDPGLRYNNYGFRCAQ